MKTTICPRGHDKAVVGVTTSRECRACRQEKDRVKAAERRAAEKLSEAQKEERRRKARERMRRLRNPVTEDGWEDEFGPVPPRDPELVDWVAALREREAAEIRRDRVGPPLRSSREGAVGSAYQPPGKRVVRVLRKVA